MKHFGSLFVEVLIAMVVFLVGLMAVASVLMFGLHSVARSGEKLKDEQSLVNEIEEYMASRIFSHTNSPSGANATCISAGKSFDIDGFTVNYSVYRYILPDKPGSRYYIIQREL